MTSTVRQDTVRGSKSRNSHNYTISKTLSSVDVSRRSTEIVRSVRLVGVGTDHQLHTSEVHIWVVVKIMVPFWVPIIIRHLIFRVPKRGP